MVPSGALTPLTFFSFGYENSKYTGFLIVPDALKTIRLEVLDGEADF